MLTLNLLQGYEYMNYCRGSCIRSYTQKQFSYSCGTISLLFSKKWTIQGGKKLWIPESHMILINCFITTLYFDKVQSQRLRCSFRSIHCPTGHESVAEQLPWKAGQCKVPFFFFPVFLKSQACFSLICCLLYYYEIVISHSFMG